MGSTGPSSWRMPPLIRSTSFKETRDGMFLGMSPMSPAMRMFERRTLSPGKALMKRSFLGKTFLRDRAASIFPMRIHSTVRGSPNKSLIKFEGENCLKKLTKRSLLQTIFNKFN